MGYKKIRATIKWWDPHTKRLKYCPYNFFDEYNNKFGKGCSPGSELMLGANTSTLPTLKTDLSDHPSIKYDIFEGNVNFPPRGTTIGVVTQCFEHHNMSYISQSENNSLWNHAFTDRNRNNVWILVIARKEPNIIPTSFRSYLKSETNR